MSTYTIPNVITRVAGTERITDVYSHLLTERIVYLGTAIDSGVANALIAQLLFLEADNPQQEINLYINSEGGDLSAMLALYDTMRFIKAPVATTCVGQAVAAGAVLLAAGEPGRRSVLRHSRVVLHQPAAQGRGAIPDLILQADEVVRVRTQLEEIPRRTPATGSNSCGTTPTVTACSTRSARSTTGSRTRSWTTGPEAAPSCGHQHGPGGTTRCPGTDATQPPDITGDADEQVGQVDAERTGDRGDHLARRLLAPAFDLGQVLR